MRDNAAHLISSKHGQTVVIDSVASIAKIASALNTKEVKAASQQVTKTTIDFVELLASDEVLKFDLQITINYVFTIIFHRVNNF